MPWAVSHGAAVNRQHRWASQSASTVYYSPYNADVVATRGSTCRGPKMVHGQGLPWGSWFPFPPRCLGKPIGTEANSPELAGIRHVAHGIVGCLPPPSRGGVLGIPD